jgi:hypothetical protein
MTNDLEQYRQDFFRTTGRPFKHFFCPILQEDSVGTGLMDGHILPQAVKSASRRTVLQRKDVDIILGPHWRPIWLNS